MSRTALCWARMLPRPAMAWGSSVMLCSPSGSASLSESPAPLCGTRGTQQVITDSRGSSRVPWTAVTSHPEPSSRGQQLADVLQAAHVGELLLQELLHPSTRAHRNHLDATAGQKRCEVGVVPGVPVSEPTSEPLTSVQCVRAFTLRLSNHGVSAAVRSSVAQGGLTLHPSLPLRALTNGGNPAPGSQHCS